MQVSKIESAYQYRSYDYKLTIDEESDLSAIMHRYFGIAVAPERFDSLLRQYGIRPTGFVDHDAQQLYDAMRNSASSILNSKSAANPVSVNVNTAPVIPWESLMTQVGLNTTGAVNQDKTNFYAKIDELQQSQALSSDQKAALNQLLAEAGYVFVAVVPQEQQQIPKVSGAEIAALMNKQFFFGGNMSSL